MSKEKDKVFFRNFTLIVGVLAIMMVIFIIAARMYGIDERIDAERRSATVAERTEPIGEVYVAGETDEASDDAMAEASSSGEGSAGGRGKEVYDNLCVSCHGSGIPGIPQLGKVDQWASHIAKGKETLYKNAINGYTGESGMMMPAKGGNADLSDDDVKAAVDYMVANSSNGGDSSSSDASKATAEADASSGGEGSAGGRGKEVYDNLCVSCHGSGIPNIPQLGKADQWASHIAKGKETLYKNAINGYTGESGMMMPAKGGNADLSDDDVKAAVDYMVENSQ